MTGDKDTFSARHLAEHAREVGRAPSRDHPWREALWWITRGRLGRRPVWSAWPLSTTTPWRDGASAERRGWRTRTAYLHDEFAFRVDYQICHRCWLGWVEQPFTAPRFQRCGLASAALAALRAEHPYLSWHTLGGHARKSRQFWAVVGADVLGGYQQRQLCPHVTAR